MNRGGPPAGQRTGLRATLGRRRLLMRASGLPVLLALPTRATRATA